MESVVDPTVAQVFDYGEQLNKLIELESLIAGFGLFFVVVVLCYFGYKFFRIFF